MCTSPALGSLGADMYERGKCDGEGYKTCRFYKAAGPQEAIISKKPDLMLNMLERQPKSSCPLMKVLKAERGYSAYCDGLDRFLTKFEVVLCEQESQRCPLRKIVFGQANL
ncbi:MAG: hypothetical protein QXL07_00125 [Fervidicoccaceae archaeon]